MTQVICKINDSNSQPLVGFVRVVADYIVTNDTTGVATVPVPNDTTLVNGQCTLNLQDSATAKVTYKIEVWQSLPDGTKGIVWQMNAAVPASITPIFLTDLVDTGITKDALDTGLISVSRRITADDNFWQRLRTDVLNWKGEYNPSTLYRRGDAVAYQGNSYVYYEQTTIAGQPPTNTSRWLLIAAKGDQVAALTAANTYTDTAVNAIRSDEFLTGSYVNGANPVLAANTWTDYFQLPITIRANNQGSLITASTNIQHNNAASQPISTRLRINTITSDRTIVNAAPSSIVTARVTELFAPLGASNYPVTLQLMSPVATTITTEACRLRAIALY